MKGVGQTPWSAGRRPRRPPAEGRPGGRPQTGGSAPPGSGWLRRWLKFNAVGAIGILVQLAALTVLKSLLGVPYLLATALAVETAVLHNFVWHELWTWKDRRGSGSVLLRLLRFNLGNGAVSLVVNLVFMRLLVGHFHMQYLIANLIAIAAGSLANYLISDFFVFRGKVRPKAAGRE